MLKHYVMKSFVNVSMSVTSSRGESSRVPSVSTKQGMDTARTEKCSKPSTNKFHDMMSISNSANTSDMRVKHYLEDQRVRREGQERIEACPELNRSIHTCTNKTADRKTVLSAVTQSMSNNEMTCFSLQQEINKTLGELERMEFPKLTAQELDALVGNSTHSLL